MEKALPLLSAYFIEKMNAQWKTEIHVPKMANEAPHCFDEKTDVTKVLFILLIFKIIP